MGIYVSSTGLTQIIIAIHFFFYGVCTVLFGICSHILLRRRKTRHYKYHLLATIALFLLVSTNVLLWTITGISEQCLLDRIYIPFEADVSCWTPLMQLLDALLETALATSAVADAILLWRCYTVWGRRYKIIILPAFLYLVGHVAGVVLASFKVMVPAGASDTLPTTLGSLCAVVAAGIVGLNNLLLSGLIAYRIFKMSREVATYLGPKSRSMYRTVMAVTLESGLLYSAFLVVLLNVYIIPFTTGTMKYAVMIQAGIVSTIIIVRVTLGISLDSVESAIISIRSASATQEEFADISRSANDLTQKGMDQPLGTLEYVSRRGSENLE